MPKTERLLTPRFTLVVTAGFAYYLALCSVLPVIPQYVRHDLGGGDVAVGASLGLLFGGAVLLRPFAGRIGDRFGRRVLIVGGAAIVAGSIALYGLFESLPYLLFIRTVTGVGEAAFLVGAASMITDLAPPTRRGEAISYWSVAVYGGLGFGPAIGETIFDAAGAQTVFGIAAALGAIAVGLAWFTRDVPRPDAGRMSGGKLVNRGALVPGLVLFFALIAYAAFAAFVPLYVDDVGLGSTDVVFLLYGGIVLSVRILGARIPDRLGPRAAGGAALALTAVGMGLMALWGSAAGLLAGTVFFALASSLLYPALLLLALSSAPERQRASVVGTFSSFFDASQAVGGPAVGGMAELTSYRGAFGLAALCAVVGMVPLRSRTRKARTAHVEEVGALGTENPS